MKDKRQKQLVIIAVLFIILGTGIAYAALSTTLTITANKITQNSLSWNVGFTGTSATGTAGGTSATGRSCGAATITSTAVTIADTTLSKPDDSCTYQLTIKNNGTIAAKLQTITPTAPSGVTCNPISGGSMVCGNITYTLASNTTGTVLSTGSTLAANGTLKVYLIAKYTGTTLNSSAVTQTGAQFSILYNQA